MRMPTPDRGRIEAVSATRERTGGLALGPNKPIGDISARDDIGTSLYSFEYSECDIARASWKGGIRARQRLTPGPTRPALHEKYQKPIEQEKLIRVPPQLDLTPYKDEENFALLRRLVRKAGHQIG
jgi:hypothetical protein